MNISHWNEVMNAELLLIMFILLVLAGSLVVEVLLQLLDPLFRLFWVFWTFVRAPR